MKSILNLGLIFCLFFFSCENKPEPIEFGLDGCYYCSMGIVDAKFAAEIVTSTGKVYKYDSIECMIRSLKELDIDTEFILVMDYNKPGTFIDARYASFLISEEIQSPMGVNLTAFKSKKAISELNKSGSTYDWNSIQDHLN